MQDYYRQAQDDPTLFLLFGDSAKLSLLPTITRCWTRIGCQRVIKTPGAGNEKQWDWGTVDVISGQTVHVVHPRRNNVGCRRMLAAISRAYDLPQHPERKVILFLDNDKAHKAGMVTQLLEKNNQQIQVEFLAPYSPEFNPQEDVWQHLRRRVTHNYYFETIQSLKQAVNEFHQELQADPQQALQLTKKWTRLIAS